MAVDLRALDARDDEIEEQMTGQAHEGKYESSMRLGILRISYRFVFIIIPTEKQIERKGMNKLGEWRQTFRRKERVDRILEPMIGRPGGHETHDAGAMQRGGEARGEYSHQVAADTVHHRLKHRYVLVAAHREAHDKSTGTLCLNIFLFCFLVHET